MIDLALLVSLPPVGRFFLGVFTILFIYSSLFFFTYWISKEE